MSPTAIQTRALDSTVVAEIVLRIEKMMTEYRLPGYAIGIVQAGQVTYARGFGSADLDTGQAVTPATLFNMASISKSFTSIAIMRLVEEGKIDLDSKVTNYLPYFRLQDAGYVDITVRHLLSHTSGLPALPEGLLPPEKLFHPENPDNDDEGLDRFVRSLSSQSTIRALVAPAGTTFEYSGIGYDILGDVIAKVSGQSYEEYMRKEVLLPLGMEESTFQLDKANGALLARNYHPHLATGEITAWPFYPSNRTHSPCSGLISSVNDLNQAALTLLNGGERRGTSIVNAESLAAMWSPVMHTNGGGLLQSYGLGWTLAELEGHHFVWHQATNIGFQANFILAPDDGVAVITLTNCDAEDGEPHYASSVGNGVMKYLLGLEE